MVNSTIMIIAIIITILIIIIKINIVIIIMKSVIATKAALLTKIMSPRHHHLKTQKKLCSY